MTREHLYEIIYVATGDRVEADSPEAAIRAALQLEEDARTNGWPTTSSDEIIFLANGQHVRTAKLSEIRT